MSKPKHDPALEPEQSDAERLSLIECPFCRHDDLLAADTRHDGYENKWSISCARRARAGS